MLQPLHGIHGTEEGLGGRDRPPRPTYGIFGRRRRAHLAPPRDHSNRGIIYGGWEFFRRGWHFEAPNRSYSKLRGLAWRGDGRVLQGGDHHAVAPGVVLP